MFSYDKFSFCVLYFYSLIHTALQFFNSTENNPDIHSSVTKGRCLAYE